MSERSATSRWAPAWRWRTAAAWVGALAALTLAVWTVTYAAYHAMAGGG